jgi:hypothetical protein
MGFNAAFKGLRENEENEMDETGSIHGRNMKYV